VFESSRLRRILPPLRTCWVLLALAGLIALAPEPRAAWALEIDASFSPVPAGDSAVRRIRGRVAEIRSLEDRDGVLRTRVTLVQPDGAPAATFAVPGGLDGGVYWVVDGAPAFVTGETVEVVLVEGAMGVTIADAPDAVLRLAASPSGRSGADYLPEPRTTGVLPAVVSIEPSLGGASPEEPVLVAVKGSGFGPVQSDSRLTFQGLFDHVDAEVVAWSEGEIQAYVPTPGLKGIPQVLSGSVKVWTSAGGWSDGDPFAGGARFSVLYQWAGDAWPVARLPVAVYLNPEGFPWGAATGEVVSAALDQWNVPGSFARLVYRGLTTAEAGDHGPGFDRRDARNTVRWRSPWPHSPSWLAVTWSAIDTLTFERLETDIEVNGERTWTLEPEENSSAFDLQSTFTHEFGHWLRLGHTQSVASVMGAFQSPGNRRRQTSPADRFGASWIHPSYGVVEVPTRVDAGSTIPVGLTALDRQGDPRPDVPVVAIAIEAIPVPEGFAAGAPGPLDPPVGVPVASVQPANPTDPLGRANALLPVLLDGLYRVVVRIDGRLVRPVPLVRVGEEPVIAPSSPALSGLAPQPLTPGARGVVQLSLSEPADVRLDLYDARGRLVRAVARGSHPAGTSPIVVTSRGSDGKSLAPGLYFLRLAPAGGSSFPARSIRIVVAS
jgi:hypothetical protein